MGALSAEPAQLIVQCAPQVAPITMAAIVQQESGGDSLALHDNDSGKTYHLGSLYEAAQMAGDLIRQGHSVDIGLAQINSKNLPALGLTMDQVLDPCTNLAAAQAILLSAWAQSGGNLQGALSAYNTGNTRGLSGARYSARVFEKAGVPSIPGGHLARWAMATKNQGDASPTTWTPQSSPLTPKGF
ncbi:MAG: lytic transglycosylase domain-containing protein [Ferrovum myxofaciens]|nr:MAG: lytic transglycosylase domain-containing protein [Ferrovum myxofaciens]